MSRNHEDEDRQEQAIAAALTTTASWRVGFILRVWTMKTPPRGLMCQKLRSVSGLGDRFSKTKDHKHEEVRKMAMQVLLLEYVQT